MKDMLVLRQAAQSLSRIVEDFVLEERDLYWEFSLKKLKKRATEEVWGATPVQKHQWEQAEEWLTKETNIVVVDLFYTDKFLRFKGFGAFAQVSAEVLTATTTDDLLALADQVLERESVELRADARALVKLLGRFSGKDRPLLPDRTFQDVSGIVGKK